MTRVRFVHVDVFACGAMSGNGLAVFLDTDGWPGSVMQRLTQEMRQIESIFLSAVTDVGATARIFTEEEELAFAGHPVLGAAAVLHRRLAPQGDARSWRIALPGRVVSVTTALAGEVVSADMDQGPASVGPSLSQAEAEPLLGCFRLASADLAPGLPLQVVSTGLPYLIVPVTSEALDRAAVHGRELEMHLARVGAKFAFLLDPEAREGRTWDNGGHREDIATGSAAGPAGAYLWSHGRADGAMSLELRQGRWIGRPSRLRVRRDGHGHLFVAGEVWPFAHGELDIPILHS